MCIDFRRLNAGTRRDAFPLPRVDDTNALGGAKFFTTLDLCAGYHLIPVAERDRPKTAFSTTDGHFHFTSMPFGVCNGPSQFQRLMTLVLAGLHWNTCLIYLDDVIVFGKTFEEHQGGCSKCFERLRSAGLKLKPSKCFLFCSSVAFLGHVICADGVLTDPEKVRVVRDWPCPTLVLTVHAFLGFCSYYRRFVKDFARRASPLYDLLWKSTVFRWTEACQASFTDLRDAMVSAPILAFPEFGREVEPFILDVDASGKWMSSWMLMPVESGLGAVLSQKQNGQERVIAYASHLLQPAETRYPVTKRELLAATWAMRHMRCYLLGKPFVARVMVSLLNCCCC